MYGRHKVIVTADDILAFWFDQAGPKRWYKVSDGFDAEIRALFEDTAIALAAGEIDWPQTPQSCLAMIIALDQFPRNMYRGTSAAFAWDRLALKKARMVVDKGWDLKINQERRAFIYMPFMHSEDMKMQDLSVGLIDSRLDNANTLHHAKEHRGLIERFGRFPHRNVILGRESREAEKDFLENGGYAP